MERSGGGVQLEEEEGQLLSVAIVGAIGAGKTCLMLRFCEEIYDEENALVTTTVGGNMASRQIRLSNGELAILEVIDTGGEERLGRLYPSFYSKLDGVIVAFDLTSMKSFQCVEDWVQDVRGYAPKDAVIVLAGTKRDVKARRAVTHEQIRSLVSRPNQEGNTLMYFETSAKLDLGVDELFGAVIETIHSVRITKEKDHIPKDNSTENLLHLDEGGSNTESHPKRKKKNRKCTII